MAKLTALRPPALDSPQSGFDAHAVPRTMTQGADPSFSPEVWERLHR